MDNLTEVEQDVGTSPSFANISPLTDDQQQMLEAQTNQNDVNEVVAEDVEEVAEVQVLVGAKRKVNPPKKKANQLVQDQFKIGPDPNRQGYLAIVCVHCKEFRSWKIFNASVASNHIIHKCRKVPATIKDSCEDATQASKQAKKQLGLIVGGPLSQESSASVSNSSGSGENVVSNGSSSRKAPSTITTTKKQSSSQQSSMLQFGHIVNEVTANCKQGNHKVRRKDDPFFQDEMVSRWGKAILRHLPNHHDTVYKRFVLPIDRNCREELKQMLHKIQGGLTIAADGGVTANGTSTILYTVSKGPVTMFCRATRLRNEAHVADAEVEDMVDFMETARCDFDTSVVCVACDNAANNIVKGACEKYRERNKSEPSILHNRDCAHCIDLVAKDLAKVPCIESVLTDAQLLMEFSTTDNIDGIRHELVRTGELPRSCGHVTNYSDTRFNKVGMTLMSITKQRQFYEWCCNNPPMFMQYYNTRNKKRQEKLDAALRLVSRDFWAKLHVLIQLFQVIEHGTKLVSSEKFPLSAYYPLVVAMRNEIHQVMKNSSGTQSFDSLFAVPGAKESIFDSIDVRFNFAGVQPNGRKVGLLDKYHVWAYIVDPFRPMIPFRPLLPSLARSVREAIDFFVHEDGSATPTNSATPPPAPGPPQYNPNYDYGDEDIAEVQQAIREIERELEPPQSNKTVVDRELRWYLGRSGDWIDLFHKEKARPSMDKNAEERQLTIEMVTKWLEDTGWYQGRMEFFSIAPSTKVFPLLIEPLLSVRATGSICVERVAKPLKNNIWNKLRASLGQDKAEVCLRVGLNLRYLLNVRSTIRQATHEQYLDCDLFGSV